MPLSTLGTLARLLPTSPVQHSDRDGFHRRRFVLNFPVRSWSLLHVAGCNNQVDTELLETVSYLLQHGAKPSALDLIRLSTNVPFPRLKVRSAIGRWVLPVRIRPWCDKFSAVKSTIFVRIRFCQVCECRLCRTWFTCPREGVTPLSPNRLPHDLWDDHVNFSPYSYVRKLQRYLEHDYGSNTCSVRIPQEHVTR